MPDSEKVTVALLTDFGMRDWYVAAMKGVILSRCPQAVVVDISHEIPPGDVASASFCLSQCQTEFPAGTIFVAVVDPGVGTQRKPLVLQSERKRFVGPDNGLFGFLKDYQAREIANAAFIHPQPSNTFHGRDVFAPVAAQLAAGAAFEEVGPPVETIEIHAWPEPEFFSRGVTGQIITFDHFGNAITNLQREEVAAQFPIESLHVSLHPDRLPLVKTFGEVPDGRPLAYFGSGGYLELGVNGGSALEVLSLHKGQTVEMLT